MIYKCISGFVGEEKKKKQHPSSVCSVGVRRESVGLENLHEL
jgi:hypothetical protein